MSIEEDSSVRSSSDRGDHLRGRVGPGDLRQPPVIRDRGGSRSAEWVTSTVHSMVCGGSPPGGIASSQASRSPSVPSETTVGCEVRSLDGDLTAQGGRQPVLDDQCQWFRFEVPDRDPVPQGGESSTSQQRSASSIGRALHE